MAGKKSSDTTKRLSTDPGRDFLGKERYVFSSPKTVFATDPESLNTLRGLLADSKHTLFYEDIQLWAQAMFPYLLRKAHKLEKETPGLEYRNLATKTNDEKTILLREPVNQQNNADFSYDGLADDELTDDELTDDELTDDELTDDELTDDELTDDELADDELADDELADDELTDDELADDELADDELAQDELSQDESSQDLMTIDHKKFVDLAYKVNRVETQPGLYAFILTPKTSSPLVTPEIKVLFAGTRDKAAVARDLEEGSAGKQSFEEHQDQLLSAVINEVSQIKGDDVKISIIGHSLGAADAQHMALVLVKELADKREPKSPVGMEKASFFESEQKSSLASKNITLNVVTNSSPLLTTKETSAFADALERIRDQAEKTTKTFCLNIHALIYNTDIVTTFGEQHITLGVSESGRRVIDMVDNVTVIKGETYQPFLHVNKGYANEPGALHQLKVLRITNTFDKTGKAGSDNTEKSDEKDAVLTALNTAGSLDKLYLVQHLRKLIYEIMRDMLRTAKKEFTEFKKQEIDKAPSYDADDGSSSEDDKSPRPITP